MADILIYVCLGCFIGDTILDFFGKDKVDGRIAICILAVVGVVLKQIAVNK